MKLAARVTKIKPSPTLAVTMRAKALQAQGRDIIGFGAGEPDFDTPANIKEAAIRAIREGFTKYTPVGGTDDLKDAIITKLKRDNDLAYGRSQVVVSCGAKHTLYNIAQALFEKGDKVIIPAPYWVSYPDMVLLAGGTPVPVVAGIETAFKLTPAQLEAAITALRTDLEKAKAAGNTRKIQDTEQALQAREEWLEQARRALSDFSG